MNMRCVWKAYKLVYNYGKFSNVLVLVQDIQSHIGDMMYNLKYKDKMCYVPRIDWLATTGTWLLDKTVLIDLQHLS